LQHPKSPHVDVIALPLQSGGSGATLYPLDLSLAEANMQVSPAMAVSIIGYPEGFASACTWPIWKTGHIASEPDLDWNGLPCFLIDATTRGGMSGSPVVARMYGSYPTTEGGVSLGGTATRFLGVYSDQYEGPEIGVVWRPQVIAESFARPGTNQ
jgi:hypothetical protein